MTILSDTTVIVASTAMVSLTPIPATNYSDRVHENNTREPNVVNDSNKYTEKETAAIDFGRTIVFEALIDDWRAERRFSSWVDDIASCSSYIKIIGMGPQVVPLILAKMKSEGDNPDHWFEALEAITRAKDPVPEEDRGNMVKMARSWFDWAEKNDVRY